MIVALALLAGCNRPNDVGGGKPQYVPAPSANAGSSGALAETPVNPRIGLASFVARIFKAAERTGSVEEHCSCAPRERIGEAHLLQTTGTVEPMENALAEISRQYPDVKWKQGAHQIIRVTDGKEPPGLLQVRVKEFLVIEDRPAIAALPALWRTAEVAAYMQRHRMRLARQGADRATVKRTAPSVIQVKNATVAEILDRMVSSYRSDEGNALYRLWAYRECRSGAQTLIDVEMF